MNASAVWDVAFAVVLGGGAAACVWAIELARQDVGESNIGGPQVRTHEAER